MKFLNLIVLFSAFSLTAEAGQLLYPSNNTLVKFSDLKEISEAFNLGIDAENFSLKETRESLLGKHYYYQQFKNGTAVDRSEIIVSVDEQGQVIKIFNSAAEDVLTKDATIPFISSTMAIDVAWKHLKVNGTLLEAPSVKLVYSAKMELVYKVSVGTSSPFGYWVITVDAQDGRVLEVADSSLPRMKRDIRVLRSSNPRLTDLSSALTELKAKTPNFLLKGISTTVQGSAQIFDPNPVVALGRIDLEDKTDSSVFGPAYVNAPLNDITFNNGVYTLKGPKVSLIDFESPTGNPSTSSSGNWSGVRGQNQFNDVMTYVHLDRSIRYIESLGFSGNKTVFKKAIEVDADGVQGQDNSHYLPGSNRLAFGHGCVDDNEDADVILHELGHAIHTNINSSWGGGDTGAMGEGFGDYWAASYTATLPHGQDTHPEWVFKWDGHNACWAGRKLNAFTPTYSSGSTYNAHATVNGGITDELWSTPIFQAFLELYNSGVPRADIDKIILEAHFGLGYGVRIPQMANAIVKTAKALFPDKDYDQVYLRHFQNQKIL